MMSEVLRGKALASLVETATVKDASGNDLELSRLRADGTVATDEELAEEAEAKAKSAAAAIAEPAAEAPAAADESEEAAEEPKED
jgi:trigger factor